MSEDRMNCNIFRAIKYKYFKQMIRYCKAFGWRYMWVDTVENPIKKLIK